MAYKKLISIDLDGVLNTYHGNYDTVAISPPREGVHEFLKNLSRKFTIDIFTARDSELVWNWLKEHELYKFINNVTNVKSKNSTVILDDRAINFDGNFSEAYRKILVFKPHWK